MKTILKPKKKKLPKKGSKVKLDPDEVMVFGPWKIPTKRKDIAKIYLKRQKALEKGFCVFCCEWLEKKRVKKDYSCPNCKKNLLDCFENGLEDKKISILNNLL
jgi:hypothetical protein